MMCDHKVYTKGCGTCEDIYEQCSYNAHEGRFDMDKEDLTDKVGWARCRSFYKSIPDDYNHEPDEDGWEDEASAKDEADRGKADGEVYKYTDNEL